MIHGSKCIFEIQSPISRISLMLYRKCYRWQNRNILENFFLMMKNIRLKTTDAIGTYSSGAEFPWFLSVKLGDRLSHFLLCRLDFKFDQKSAICGVLLTRRRLIFCQTVWKSAANWDLNSIFCTKFEVSSQRTGRGKGGPWQDKMAGRFLGMGVAEEVRERQKWKEIWENIWNKERTKIGAKNDQVW